MIDIYTPCRHEGRLRERAWNILIFYFLFITYLSIYFKIVNFFLREILRFVHGRRKGGGTTLSVVGSENQTQNITIHEFLSFFLNFQYSYHQYTPIRLLACTYFHVCVLFVQSPLDVIPKLPLTMSTGRKATNTYYLYKHIYREISPWSARDKKIICIKMNYKSLGIMVIQGT